jgi:type IV secretory pathway VirB10-like protein
MQPHTWSLDEAAISMHGTAAELAAAKPAMQISTAPAAAEAGPASLAAPPLAPPPTRVHMPRTPSMPPVHSQRHNASSGGGARPVARRFGQGQASGPASAYASGTLVAAARAARRQQERGAATHVELPDVSAAVHDAAAERRRIADVSSALAADTVARLFGDYQRRQHTDRRLTVPAQALEGRAVATGVLW